MEFGGFINSDFDFFKKKNSMNKIESEQKKEEVKRHFREFCYEIQKNYHSVMGGALLLDKNFQGLNKNKNYISARSQIVGMDFCELYIYLFQDCISISLICPPDDDFIKIEKFKKVFVSKKEIFLKFFKEDKNMFLLLCKKSYKKASDDLWTEEVKFENNELVLGDYQIIVDNINKLQSIGDNSKMISGIHIKAQYSKSDVIRMGKVLSSKANTEIIRLLNLCESIK